MNSQKEKLYLAVGVVGKPVWPRGLRRDKITYVKEDCRAAALFYVA